MSDAFKKEPSPCEGCARYEWDDGLCDWVCLAEPDEDELFAALGAPAFECRYYRPKDGYDLSERQAKPF